MAVRTSYRPGTPSWVELATPDCPASAEFYGDLFGWSAEMDPRPEAGGYGMFRLRGKSVAALRPQTDESMPPYWSVYVTVADAAATLDAMAANGATVLLGPMDVFDAGRTGVVHDPVGSFVSIWQPKEHIGAELVNEAGTFTWNELATNDLAAATAFYRAVFGWGIDAEGSSDTSSIFTVDGEVVCGAHQAGEGEFPAWSVWFAVDDCDAAATKTVELGGSILMPPTDMDFGRGAVVCDPHGAVFAVGVINDAS